MLRYNGRSHRVHWRRDRRYMQHRKEPPLIAPLYWGGPSIGLPRLGMAGEVENVDDSFPNRLSPNVSLTGTDCDAESSYRTLALLAARKRHGN
jgi:hypothetical protein